MTTATKAKPKTNPPQCDVRILGGRTTVKLRAPGNKTLERMNALLAELYVNAATNLDVRKCTEECHDAMLRLSIALGFSGLPTPSEQGDEEAE